jgi:hypothetical protein
MMSDLHRQSLVMLKPPHYNAWSGSDALREPGYLGQFGERGRPKEML